MLSSLPSLVNLALAPLWHIAPRIERGCHRHRRYAGDMVFFPIGHPPHRHFWWMIPLSAIMYYTVFLFRNYRKTVWFQHCCFDDCRRNRGVGQLLLVLGS